MPNNLRYVGSESWKEKVIDLGHGRASCPYNGKYISYYIYISHIIIDIIDNFKEAPNICTNTWIE